MIYNQIKPCFWCGNEHIYIDRDNLCITCTRCLDNNIEIKIRGKSVQECIDKWNNRYFDKYLLHNLNNASGLLRYMGLVIKNDPNINTTFKSKLFAYSLENKSNVYSGYFIDPKGSIIAAQPCHEIALCNLMGISTDLLDEDTLNCARLMCRDYLEQMKDQGYIDVSLCYDSCEIEYKRINSCQIDSLLSILTPNIQYIEINGEKVEKISILEKLHKDTRQTVGS